MEVKISLTNSKLGAQIPSVSVWRIGSCRADAHCFKHCYANHGNFRFKNVQKSLKSNLAYFITHPKEYFNEIIQFLNAGLTTYKFFRWSVAGDIVNDDYFLGMIRVAKKCKQTKFLCFTKKYDIVNNYVENGGKIPTNLQIIFSHWDKTWEEKINNPYNFCNSYVNFKDNSLNPKIPEDAIPCGGHCESCLGCWNLKKGASIYFNQH